MRSGGGYPGGSDCHNYRPQKDRKPTSQPAGFASPFSYTPRSSYEPVSIIIPSFSRPSNLPFALAWLLRLEPLHRTKSEILVTHGSMRSFAAATVIDANVTRLCNGAPAARTCAAGFTQRVRHLDAIALNTEVLVAQRHFAGRNATNAVLLHLDDDLVPSESMLQALIDRVASERGFPDYVHDAPGLYGPSGLGRSCGKAGYDVAPRRDDEMIPTGGAFLPSQLTATSAAANGAYLSRFDDFRPLLRSSGGNGEDLAFAFSVGDRGGARLPVGYCAGRRALAATNPRAWRDACATREVEIAWVRGNDNDETLAARGQYHTRQGHLETRGQICRCLALGRLSEALRECVSMAKQEL